jgi:hypothetical protein
MENIYWVFTYPGMWDFDKQGILASAVEMVSLQNENTE